MHDVSSVISPLCILLYDFIAYLLQFKHRNALYYNNVMYYFNAYYNDIMRASELHENEIHISLCEFTSGNSFQLRFSFRTWSRRIRRLKCFVSYSYLQRCTKVSFNGSHSKECKHAIIFCHKYYIIIVLKCRVYYIHTCTEVQSLHKSHACSYVIVYNNVWFTVFLK